MKMILRKNPFPFRGGSLENEFSWNVSVSDQKKFMPLRRTVPDMPALRPDVPCPE